MENALGVMADGNDEPLLAVRDNGGLKIEIDLEEFNNPELESALSPDGNIGWFSSKAWDVEVVGGSTGVGLGKAIPFLSLTQRSAG